MAALVNLPYTRLYKGRWRWFPPGWMRSLGAVSETLTADAALTPAAIARATELSAFWAGARNDLPHQPNHGTINWLIGEYERSDWYMELAPRTKEEADHALKIIREKLGTAKVTYIKRRHIRAFHTKAMHQWTRNKANKLTKWLRRLLSYAVEIGLREDNPARYMQLRHNPPRRIRWTIEEVEAIKAAAIEAGLPHIALLVQLGYDTSQRLSDLLSAKWSQLDGEGITFIQAKTGVEVWIPLSDESLRMLATTSRSAITIITTPAGRPYRSRAGIERPLRTIMQKVRVRPELQFRDLRRTAASEVLAGGGRAEPLTGHVPGSSVVKVYELPNREAARQAQAARERARTTKGERREKKVQPPEKKPAENLD